MAAICFAGGDASRLVVFSFALAARPVGFLVALAEPGSMNASIGAASIARRDCPRLRVPGELAVVWDESLHPFTRSLASIVEALCKADGPVLMLQSATAGGKLEQIAHATRELSARLIRADGGSRERHWSIADVDFEKYFATFSSSSRKSLRQTQRQLVKSMDGHLRVATYRHVDEVDEYFAAATEISSKTYQWQNLGLGMRNRDFVLRRLRVAAELGFMRCHLLFCRDQPVAFSEGFAVGGVYLESQTGYLPEMARHSVGTVLTLEMMREVLAAGGEPWSFDWQSGNDSYKRTFSNVTRLERTLYLLPRSFGWRVFSTCFGFTQACNHAVQQVRTFMGRVSMARYRAALMKLLSATVAKLHRAISRLTRFGNRQAWLLPVADHDFNFVAEVLVRF
jgi:hypothetical protein